MVMYNNLFGLKRENIYFHRLDSKLIEECRRLQGDTDPSVPAGSTEEKTQPAADSSVQVSAKEALSSQSSADKDAQQNEKSAAPVKNNSKKIAPWEALKATFKMYSLAFNVMILFN
jgi:hypothetical protein